MEKFNFNKKSFLNLGLLTLLSMCIANTGYTNTHFNSKYYFGIDAIYSNMKFRKDYGSNTFAKSDSIPGINVFIGYRFKNSFGIEAGYETARTRKKTPIVTANNYIAGWLMPAIMGTGIFSSKVYQQHPYLGVTLNSKVNDMCDVSTLLAVSVSKIKATYNMKQPVFFINQHASFSKTKPIAMARVALTYKSTENVALRAFFTWKDTSVFKNVKAKQGNIVANLIKLNNYFNFGIGVLFL